MPPTSGISVVNKRVPSVTSSQTIVNLFYFKGYDNRSGPILRAAHFKTFISKSYEYT